MIEADNKHNDHEDVTHIDNIRKNAENIAFDVADWNAGLYFINIKTDKETLIRKFVKN